MAGRARPASTATANLAAALLFALAGVPAHAQPQSDPLAQAVQPSDESTLLSALTVTAPADRKTVEKKVDTYVTGVTIRPENWSVARWRAPICPLVAGLAKVQGQAVLLRMAEIARQAGAPLTRRKCTPNLYVVVTSEPEHLLRAWKERNPNLFGYDLPARVTRFIQTDRPIRVWYNAARLAGDGESLTNGGDTRTARQNLRAKSTRLEWNGLRTFESIVVVVDAKRISGLRVFQLADYAAMVGLTELDLDRGVGDAPSILRLFTAEAGGTPQELTSFDKAFLEALYHTSSQNRLQRSSIANRVLNELMKPPEPAAAPEGPAPPPSN
jgi:hypothetical protein